MSPSWVKWRRARFGVLRAGGLSTDGAWRVAKAETAARRRLAPTIGLANARAADLVAFERGGKLRFALRGDVAALEAGQLRDLLNDGGARLATPPECAAMSPL